MKTYVGIDFGACYIKAAKISSQLNRVQPVKLNMNIAGGVDLPAVILYDKINGEIEFKIGDSAQSSVDVENKISRLTPKLALKNWGKYIPNLDCEISAADAFKDIFSKIWRHISKQAARDENFDVTVTVPAAFSDVQKKIVRHAAICADVPISTIISEPFAAIFAREEIFQADDSQFPLIFDFGATTLDITLFELKRTAKTLNVTKLSAATLNYGGADIDESILRNIFATKYAAAVEIFRDNPFELLTLIEKMKEEIFLDEEEISSGSLIDGNGNLYEFELTRQEIFTAIEKDGVKEKIIEMLDDLLDDAGILPNEVTKVEPIGGTSSIDYFLDVLTNYFGENIFDADDFEREGITLNAAIGAAMYRKLTDEENMRVKLKNIVPCGIYIQRGDKFFRCIRRNELRGFITPYKPILIDELKKNKWRLSIYQSFCNEVELSAESGSAVFIGDVKLDSRLYETETILFKMKLTAAGRISIKFFEDRKVNGRSKIVFVEEKILGISK